MKNVYAAYDQKANLSDYSVNQIKNVDYVYELWNYKKRRLDQVHKDSTISINS
jgi:hypothetical protein